MKRILSFLLLVSFLFALCSCGGDIEPRTVAIGEIKLEIPGNFIYDSTQSNSTFKVFEKGWYSQMILLSCSALNGDAEASLEGYAEYIKENGGSAELTSFKGSPAALAEYTKDEKACRELMFAHNGILYAVALRGGTDDDFTLIINSVVFPSSADAPPPAEAAYSIN